MIILPLLSSLAQINLWGVNAMSLIAPGTGLIRVPMGMLMWPGVVPPIRTITSGAYWFIGVMNGGHTWLTCRARLVLHFGQLIMAEFPGWKKGNTERAPRFVTSVSGSWLAVLLVSRAWGLYI